MPYAVCDQDGSSFRRTHVSAHTDARTNRMDIETFSSGERAQSVRVTAEKWLALRLLLVGKQDN